MITKTLRKTVQTGITAHVARHPKLYGVNPNTVTFLALVVAVPACWAIAREQYLWAVAFILLSGALDLVDGCIARALERTSRFGTYWDAMVDRYVDCLLYFGFVLAGFELEAFLATVGTLLTSYAKPRTAITVEIYREDWPTIGERTERFLLLLAGLLFASAWPRVAGVSTIACMLWLTVVMTHIGAVQRIVMTRRRLREQDGKES